MNEIRKLDKQHIPEGHTIIFEGPQRSGKTLGMVAFAVDSFKRGRNVFSNIQLGVPHEPLEFSDVKLADGSRRFWNGHIAIDELNFFFDSRRSASSANVEFSAFLLQQKKQGCHLTGTTHDLYSLDVRLRMNYDFLVTPTVYPAFPEPPQMLKLVIQNGPLQRRFKKTLVFDCRPFLGLYDTFAVYDPFKGLSDDDDGPPRRKRQRAQRPASRVEL